MSGPLFAKPPRLNHVALSVAPEALDDAGRADLVAFYGDVFGFEEYPQLTEDRARLVLRAHTHEQFVFLIATPQPHGGPPPRPLRPVGVVEGRVRRGLRPSRRLA